MTGVVVLASILVSLTGALASRPGWGCFGFGAAPSPALFRLFPGAAGAPAAGMGRGCALAVEATSGRLPRLPKVTVLSRQRLPPKDDI